MTVYYCHFWQGGSSVDKKIIGKIKWLNKLGQRSIGVFVTATDVPKVEMTEIQFVPLQHFTSGKLNKLSKAKNDYWQTLFLYASANCKAKDVLIHRFPLFVEYSFLNFVKRLPCRVIVEHNTMEWVEGRADLNQRSNSGLKKLLLYWDRSYYFLTDKFLKRKLLQLVWKGVSVCNEIDRYEKSYFPNYQTAVIANGIDVQKIESRKAPVFDGSTLKILMVSGWASEWLGLDILIEGLLNYKGSVKVEVFFAGEPFLPHQKKAKQLNNSSIKFLGRLDGDSYSKLFDTCHIALGTLADFRIGLNEACNLKTREYMSRGIPFVIDHEDTDVIAEPRWLPYLMRSTDKKSLNIHKVISFANQVLSDEQHPQKMRALALETIDYSCKMSALNKFINQ